MFYFIIGLFRVRLMHFEIRRLIEPDMYTNRFYIIDVYFLCCQAYQRNETFLSSSTTGNHQRYVVIQNGKITRLFRSICADPDIYHYNRSNHRGIFSGTILHLSEGTSYHASRREHFRIGLLVF